MEQVEVSVEELLSGLRQRGVPLPFEIGAFIALEACEQVLDRPIRIDARDVGIGDIGEVVCAVRKAPASEESAVRALLQLLSELLVCSAPGVPAMLLELVERGPSGEWTLERLRDELEACLLPLNRGATRRVLARLTRDARRTAAERASARPAVPDAIEIDAQFDALMGTDGTRAPRPRRAGERSARSSPGTSASTERSSSPGTYAAAERSSPGTHAAAERSSPGTHATAERSSPGTHAAAERSSPGTHAAAERSSPGTYAAAERSSPGTYAAAERSSPPPPPRGSFAQELGVTPGALESTPTSERPAADGGASLRALRTAVAVQQTHDYSEQERGAEGASEAAPSDNEPSPSPSTFTAGATSPSSAVERRGDEADWAPAEHHDPFSRESMRVRERDDAEASSGPSSEWSSRPGDGRAARSIDRKRRVRRRYPSDPVEAPAARSGRRGRPEPQPRSSAPASRASVDSDHDDLLADLPEQNGSRLPRILSSILVLVAAGLLGAYLALGQTGARRVLGLTPLAEGPPPRSAASPVAPQRSVGELRVNSQPGRAQVLLRVGSGPALASDLAVGVAQEFVALADGYAPTRAVVPADAEWEAGEGQRRYELAMQATRPLAADTPLDLGPSLLPRDVGSPSGELGSVRVITTPRGASVYQLIGFTPDVRVENLPLDEAYEILVFLPDHTLARRRLELADWKGDGERRSAELDIELSPARARR